MIVDSSSLGQIVANNSVKSPSEAYVISMSSDVFQTCLERLKNKVSFPLKMFDAVKGSSLTNYVKNYDNVSVRGQNSLASVYRDSNYDLTTLNSVGCYLSHVSLWLKLYEENLEGMYIFESDAYCLSDVNIEEFKKTDGDILLFGSPLIGDSFLVPVNYGRQHGITKIEQHFFGTHAYYITYKGAVKALQHAFPIEAQVDAYLSYINKLKLINIYGYYPSKCSQLAHQTSMQTKYTKHIYDSSIIIACMFFLIVLLTIAFIIMYFKKAKTTPNT